jgi:hypothetical protein
MTTMAARLRLDRSRAPAEEDRSLREDLIYSRSHPRRDVLIEALVDLAASPPIPDPFARDRA